MIKICIYTVNNYKKYKMIKVSILPLLARLFLQYMKLLPWCNFGFLVYMYFIKFALQLAKIGFEHNQNCVAQIL